MIPFKFRTEVYEWVLRNKVSTPFSFLLEETDYLVGYTHWACQKPTERVVKLFADHLFGISR